MSKLAEIIEGWSKLIWQDKETEKLAKERIVICLNCDDLKDNQKCKICGCFMPAKVRSKKSNCPAQPPKWQ